jgi:predicted metalloprotease with PDZ domain
MPNPCASRVALVAALIGLNGIIPRGGRAQALEPIIYHLKVPAPDTHIVEVEAIVPAGKGTSIEIMMATWSPGFYRVEDYAKRVQGLSARTTDGVSLEVEATRKNRWRIQTAGGPKFVVSYRLICDRSSVTTNYVGADLGVINGAPTFITLVEHARRPHEVRLALAPKWKRSVTALEPAADGRPDHYLARDYDTLVDSPIVAGDPVVHEFEVDGSKHYLVDVGDVGSFDVHSETLDWFGLRFAPRKDTEKKEEPKKQELASEWKLEVRADASDTQKQRLQKLLEPAKGQ